MPESAGNDINAKLMHDYREGQQPLSRVDRATRAEAGQVFWKLTNELVSHEVAEEEIVYPEVCKAIPRGNRVADAWIKEQAEAGGPLSMTERAGPASKPERAAAPTLPSGANVRNVRRRLVTDRSAKMRFAPCTGCRAPSRHGLSADLDATGSTWPVNAPQTRACCDRGPGCPRCS